MPFKLWGTLPCQPVFSHPVTHLHQKLQGQPHQSAPPPLNKAYVCVTVIRSAHQVAHISPDLLPALKCPTQLPQDHSSTVMPPTGCATTTLTSLCSGSTSIFQVIHVSSKGFPGGPVGRNPPCHAGDTRSNPGLGRFHMSQGS